MTSTLESVTAATRLRRDTMEVQHELEEKRSDYQRRVERVRENEEHLIGERAKLQETLTQYYKYIQDNDVKRSRANKKAATEERTKLERQVQLQSLQAQLAQLEADKSRSRAMHQRFVRYQRYLEEVLQHNDSDEYQDPRDVIKRFDILDDNKTVLQRRKTQLEEDLGKHKVQLNAKRARKKNESVDLQNQLGELQNLLEQLQKEYKARHDDLDSYIHHRGGTTKTVGQVRMSCRNLFDRCMDWNSAYRSRAHHREALDSDVVHQLTVIGDCLEDYSYIIRRHQEKQREARTTGH